jgi:replicative DNA helicase
MQRTYKKKFAIFEWPPDECSVSHIYALLDSLRRTDGWRPDVIIIDYMDLMVSRNNAYNVDDYTRQKHVANEVRGLAKNEDALIFTATQTNRSGASGGSDGKLADLDKAAESYAKQFSLDYIVSLNQTTSQRKATPPRLTMFIAKNRNGPKHVSIDCTINYNSMLVREVL